MSNPFEYLSRRTLIKGTLLATFFSSAFGRAIASTNLVAAKLSATASTQVSVTVTAIDSAKIYIEYGTSAGSMKSKTSIFNLAKGESKAVTLNGLKENSKVYYRVRFSTLTGKTFGSLPIATATTTVATSKGSESIFAIQADPHMDENSSADVYNGTLKQIVAASPLFLMDLGDIFMVDKLPDKSEANIRARFELMKGYYEKLGSIPLKITLGNHDGELGYSKFNTKNYRKEYFPEQTGDLAYYSFTSPNALHISLDPFTYTVKNPTKDGWEWTLGKTQYDWLKKTLESSTATHKFIYIHHLLVGDPQSRGGVEIAKLNEWGGNNNDGTYGFDTQRPGWGKPIHQLLKENGVGIVFKGHDHLYVKQEPDGIVYQTLPQPSHPGEKIDVTQYGYLSGKGVGGSGYLKVTTQGTLVKVEFISFDGRVLDTYTHAA
jgi:hypothetical protein